MPIEKTAFKEVIKKTSYLHADPMLSALVITSNTSLESQCKTGLYNVQIEPGIHKCEEFPVICYNQLVNVPQL